jgi:hypothetical protein
MLSDAEPEPEPEPEAPPAAGEPPDDWLALEQALASSAAPTRSGSAW